VASEDFNQTYPSINQLKQVRKQLPVDSIERHLANYIAEHYSFDTYYSGMQNHVVIVSQKFKEKPSGPSREITSKTKGLQYSVPKYSILVRAENPRMAALEAYKQTIEMSSNLNGDEILNLACRDLLETSSIVYKCYPHCGGVNLKTSTFKVPIILAPVLKCIALQSKIPIRKDYECSICLEKKDFVVPCSNHYVRNHNIFDDVSVYDLDCDYVCQSAICFTCYERKLANQQNNKAIPCVQRCKHYFLGNEIDGSYWLDYPNGYSAIHHSTISGCSVSGMARHLTHLNSQVIHPKYTSDVISMIKRAIGYVWGDFWKSRTGEIDIIDFTDSRTFCATTRDDSACGAYYNCSRKKPLKADVMPALKANIMHQIMKLKNSSKWDFESIVAELKPLLGDSSVLADKVEVKCGEWDSILGQFIYQEGERFFFIANGELIYIIKPLFYPLSRICGIGDSINPMPIKIGMKFHFGAATAFFMELYNITKKRLKSIKKTLYLTEMAKLQSELVSLWIIVESDFSKYDLHLLAFILMETFGGIRMLFKNLDNLLPNGNFIHDLFLALLKIVIETVGFKVVNAPDGSGWWIIIGTMTSGRYDTSIFNSIVNFVMQLVVIQVMFPSIDIIHVYKAGFIRYNFYGDDAVSLFYRQLFHSIDQQVYIKTWKDLFNMVIKESNFKIHNTIFWSETHDSPTFLKYSIGHRWCDRHNCVEMYFIRDARKTIPKLYISSEIVTTPALMWQKAICCAYSAGTNPITYQIAHGWAALAISDVDESELFDFRDQYITKKKLQYELTDVDFSTFPSYEQVMDRFACGDFNSKSVFKNWRDLVADGES
jgi:hypothetical protein